MKTLHFPDRYEHEIAPSNGRQLTETIEFLAIGSSATAELPGSDSQPWSSKSAGDLFAGLSRHDFEALNLENARERLGRMFAATRAARLERQRRRKNTAAYLVRLRDGSNLEGKQDSRPIGIVSLMRREPTTASRKILDMLQKPSRSILPVVGEPKTVAGWVRTVTVNNPAMISKEVLGATVNLARYSGVTALHASVTPEVQFNPSQGKLVSVEAYVVAPGSGFKDDGDEMITIEGKQYSGQNFVADLTT